MRRSHLLREVHAAEEVMEARTRTQGVIRQYPHSKGRAEIDIRDNEEQ